MIRFHSGSTKAVNTCKAAAECLRAAGAGRDLPPDLIIVHTTSGHDYDQMLLEYSEIAPEAEITGCTGSGVISGGFVSEA